MPSPVRGDAVSDLFATYPATIAATAAALRSLILTTLPKVEETLDPASRIIGYGYGPGYKGMVCTIIPSKGGVKLGIVGGAVMPDPNGLLEGTGQVHRHVPLASPAEVERPAVRRVLKAALAAWRERDGA